MQNEAMNVRDENAAGDGTEDVYPSRSGPAPRFLERLDPVIHDREGALFSGPLPRKDLDAFERNGFLYFPRFFPAEEIATFRKELERLRGDDDVRRQPQTITEPGSGDVRSVFEVHRSNAILGRLARDRRLAGIARQILGGDVYVHQSRINYKPGFRGREFYWHADFETWHVEDGMPRMRALSISIALTENVPENGPTMVIPGSHRRYLSCIGETPEEHYKRSLKKQEYGVPDDASLARLIEEGGLETPVGPAGSILVFDCNLMHGSGSNITPWPRSNIFFCYNSVANALVSPYCGLPPRPEFIASRDPTPLDPA